jgi:eukaryotic-like serine/threonine-protein kinase
MPSWLRCPDCGQVNPPDATFCGECGQWIKIDDTLPTGSQQPTEKNRLSGCLPPLVIMAGLVFLVAIALIALPRFGVPLPVALGALGSESEPTATSRSEATETRLADGTPSPSPVPPTDIPDLTNTRGASPTTTPTLTPFPTPTRVTATSTTTPSPTATADVGPERIILGETIRGTALEAVRFGNGPRTVIFIGGMAAGFAPSTVALAEAVVDHFTRNLSLIPENLTVIVVLSASPDTSVTPGNYSGRLNANGVDINRNWDCEWAADTRWQGETKRGSGGTAPFSEPESRILRDLIQKENTVGVIFWQARAEGGLVSPGGCGDRIEMSAALAGIYGLSAGYRVENFEDLTRQTLNGDASNYLDSIGIPAVSVLLPNYSSSIDWDNNLDGIMAVLDSYAD